MRQMVLDVGVAGVCANWLAAQTVLAAQILLEEVVGATAWY